MPPDHSMYVLFDDVVEPPLARFNSQVWIKLREQVAHCPPFRM